jgi:hypothetical protein
VLLDDGERVGELTIRLYKLGAITGSVVDDSGEPLVGVSLRSYRRVLIGGRRVFTPFGGNTMTDDRGMYRLANLVPGEYVISVPSSLTTMPSDFVPDGRAPNFEATMSMPGSMGFSFGSGGRQLTPDSRFLLQQSSNSAANVVVTPDGRLRSTPTIFHSSSRTIGEAQIIAVDSGEERSGIDLVVPLVPAANISGQLVSPEGPASGYAIHLIPGDADDMTVETAAGSAVTAADGSFMFLAVPAGQYVLQTVRVPRNRGPVPPPPPPPPPPSASGRFETMLPIPASPVAAVSDQPLL